MKEYEYVLISDLSYKLGQWRAQADAFARYLRSNQRSQSELDRLLSVYDELAARQDGSVCE